LVFFFGAAFFGTAFFAADFLVVDLELVVFAAVVFAEVEVLFARDVVRFTGLEVSPTTDLGRPGVA
jgi:hypothetical protein